MTDDASEQWHLDKRVPLALIFAIAVQTGGALWWASNVTQRMAQVEHKIETFATNQRSSDRTISNQGQDIAVLVEQIEGTNRGLDRLHAQMEATNSLLRQILTDQMRGPSK